MRFFRSRDIMSIISPRVQRNGPPGGAAGSNYLILGFFFLTGLTGLAYELVWIRLLILAFGSTQFAVTTVLVTFMAGLALGSFIFGRFVDKYHSPLKVYAGIEILLGIYCILSPLVFSLVREIYLFTSPSTAAGVHAGFEASQFMLSFLALIVPTTLMGGTLPVLVKYLASASGRVGFHTAVPYSVNTLGAVTGCLFTGFFALYVLGVKTTVYTAGAIDILVGALVYFIYGSIKSAPVLRAVPRLESALSRESSLNLIIIISFAVSGFASLSYETLWTRVFSLVIGSSIYAFTVMLATFLVGIGAGSILFAPLVDRMKKPVAWFAILEAVIGGVSLVSIFAYRELPFVFFSLKESFSEQFWLFLFIQFLLCAAIMIIPTLCMGAIFPLVGRIYTKNLSTVGRNIGDIYFFNTAGSIFGAFAGGFILIPYIGVQNGVIITAALNLVIAAVLTWRSGLSPSFKKGFTGALGAFFIIVTIFIPPWEKMVMTMGFYVNPVEGKAVEEIKGGTHRDRLVYYKEGVNAIVTVRKGGENEGTVSYQANGKQEARSVNGAPSVAWSILGHIPLLMHPGKPENALVIGLGSGITLGAMQSHPLDSFDVVELEPAVVEASRFFKEANNDALGDKRVKLHVTDGRSFLFSERQKYDVIVSGVSDPWITGVSNLFTYEYFEELGNKVKDDGVVALWFQNYRITPKELKIGLNTFASVFPHVSVWFHYTDTLDLVVIGSKKPHGFDMKKLSERLEHPPVKTALSRVNIHGPYEVLDLFLIGNDDIRSYMGSPRLNTDERPILEFTLPRLLYMDPALGIKTVEEIIAHVKDVVPPVKVADKDRAAFYMDLGKTFNRSEFRLAQALKVFEKALELDPGNREAAQYIKSIRDELGDKL